MTAAGKSDGRTMGPREEVLARIRTALGAREPDAPAAGGAGPGGYRTRSDRTSAELLSLFAERLGDYGSNVRRCEPGQLSGTVAVALAERGARRVAVPAGLEVVGSCEGVEFVVDDGMTAQELDGVDGVVTLAAVAIAETGTIVLDGSAGQGRRALTLVPDYHLCIVRGSQVVGLVTEAMESLRPDGPLTWISGPSATSDIELDRVQGVHGPRTLEVVLVSDGPPQPVA